LGRHCTQIQFPSFQWRRFGTATAWTLKMTLAACVGCWMMKAEVWHSHIFTKSPSSKFSHHWSHHHTSCGCSSHQVIHSMATAFQHPSSGYLGWDCWQNRIFTGRTEQCFNRLLHPRRKNARVFDGGLIYLRC
jgi:hypothetical protein